MAPGVAHKQDHLASETLLRKIDKLREKNVGQHVSLPQLVVVGDQSSGKSSLLESLTGLPFPRDVELCTRYATQITSRRDSESRIEVTIFPGPHASDDHKKHLAGFTATASQNEDFAAQFPGILEEVNTRMGIRTDDTATSGTVFSEDVLKVEICGPDEDYLTVIDVPGIFRNPTEGVTTKEDMILVKRLVEGYIKDSRTIILAVLPSNVDIATQEILTIAAEYDKTGERTLAVLTKPDLVKERSAQAAVCSLVLGKKKKLTLGCYVVRNRGADDKGKADIETREAMFRGEPWNTLPPNRVGVLALKARLTDLLGEITKRDFPKLRKEIGESLKACEWELEGLGPSRQDEKDQRLFLSNMARKFQDHVRAALDPHYASYKIFEEKEETRLITVVAYLTECFNRDFDEKALLRQFENLAANSTANPAVKEQKKEQKATWITGDGMPMDLFLRMNPHEFPDLEGFITDDEEVDEPDDGIMEWISDLYIRSRGVEIGTFSSAILSSAFKEQSTKWPSMTQAFVSRVIFAIHRFTVTLLQDLCPDEHVRDELSSTILDSLLSRYKSAMDRAMFLVSVEREKRPYTLNEAFSEALRITHGQRVKTRMAGDSHKEWKIDSGGAYSATGKRVVDLDFVQTATASKCNIEQAKEEIHDTLQSYYAIAQKRFVDNVYREVVNHSLLTSPDSPLAVFSQEWVIGLDADQLSAIAGESLPVKERRDELKRKIEDLEAAIKILRH